MKILFVCLGNICRSPLAHGVARDYILKNGLDVEVDSCGTGSWHINQAPCQNSQKVAKMHNIDISDLRARQVTKDDFTYFDKIVALDDSNYYDLLELGCPKEKLSKLGDYGFNSQDVLDPYYFKDFEGFIKVYEMIESCVFNLLKIVK